MISMEGIEQMQQVHNRFKNMHSMLNLEFNRDTRVGGKDVDSTRAYSGDENFLMSSIKEERNQHQNIVMSVVLFRVRGVFLFRVKGVCQRRRRGAENEVKQHKLTNSMSTCDKKMQSTWIVVQRTKQCCCFMFYSWNIER